MTSTVWKTLDFQKQKWKFEVSLTCKEAFAFVIAPRLKELGFKKERHNWRFFDEDYIRVINLQNEQYTSDFFINFGAYWLSRGGMEKPYEHDCDARARITDLVPESLKDVASDGKEVRQFETGYKFSAKTIDSISPLISCREKLLFEYGVPRLMEYPKNANDELDWWVLNP